MTEYNQKLEVIKKRITLSRNQWDGESLDYVDNVSLLDFHLSQVLDFLSLTSYNDLCKKILKMPAKRVYGIIEKPFYADFEIPKKRGGVRKITAPSSLLKEILRRLNHHLQFYYLVIRPSFVHGFILHPANIPMKCNIFENARLHVRKKHVLSLDLQNFFPSITSQRVMKMFESELFEFNNEVSAALTLLCSYQGKLPVGAPTSPVISNFICFEMDYQLNRFAQKNGLVYSRYADDLTFSSDYYISEEKIDAIEQIIKEQHFVVNLIKKRVVSSGSRQSVTGLTVNDYPNVSRKLLKKIRAMLHDMDNNGLESAATRHFKMTERASQKEMNFFENRLKGYIDFVGQIRGKNDEMYKKMIKDYYRVSLIE